MRRGVLGLRIAFASLVLCGCGDDGDTTDGGRRDVPTSGPMLPTCDGPAPLSGTDGVVATIMLDTTEGQPPTLDLSECSAPPAAPQVVVDYVVPGTGPHAVAITTDVPGTMVEDTVVAIRTEACERPDGRLGVALCIDDGGMVGTLHSVGSFSASGGDHVFIIVTGYGADDLGVIQLDVIATPNEPPTLDDAYVTLVEGTSIEVEVTGGDVDGNALGVSAVLLDAARSPVDVTANGAVDTADVKSAAFEAAVTGATRFTETAVMSVMSPVGVREASIRLFDEAGTFSDPLVVPVETGMRVAFGQPCDGTTTICPRELICSAMVCQGTPDRAAACAAAPEVTIATPTTTTTSASEMGVLMPGDGRFRGTCSSTQGQELLYRVTVPNMGSFDLIATTATPGTATGADTVLYVRADCVNPDSSMMDWCNDDVEPGVRLTSTVEILAAPPGTYTVFVEDWQGVAAGMTTRFELQVSLRPVLSTGTACDPDGVSNRCLVGPCPMDTMVCG